MTGTIETGPHTGFQYRADSAADTPPIEEGTEISGAPTFVGLGCCTTYPGSVPAGTGVALVERGVCTFQERLDSITAAGYSAGTVVMSTRSKPPSQKHERNLREAPARQPTVRCLDDLPCLDERR